MRNPKRPKRITESLKMSFKKQTPLRIPLNPSNSLSKLSTDALERSLKLSSNQSPQRRKIKKKLRNQNLKKPKKKSKPPESNSSPLKNLTLQPSDRSLKDLINLTMKRSTRLTKNFLVMAMLLMSKMLAKVRHLSTKFSYETA